MLYNQLAVTMLAASVCGKLDLHYHKYQRRWYI